MSGEASESDLRSRGLPRSGYASRPKAATRSGYRTLRALFFMLASVWGFMVGVGGLLFALRSTGQSAQPSLGVLLSLIPVLGFAMCGGLAIAWAYRESRSRSR